MNEALELAERIASLALWSATRYMKANVNASGGVDFRTMLDREAETHLRCGSDRRSSRRRQRLYGQTSTGLPGPLSMKGGQHDTATSRRRIYFS